MKYEGGSISFVLDRPVISDQMVSGLEIRSVLLNKEWSNAVRWLYLRNKPKRFVQHYEPCTSRRFDKALALTRFLQRCYPEKELVTRLERPLVGFVNCKIRGLVHPDLSGSLLSLRWHCPDQVSMSVISGSCLRSHPKKENIIISQKIMPVRFVFIRVYPPATFFFKH